MNGEGPGGDRIEIRDLRVVGVHGVLPEERERAQPFSLDIVAWLDMAAAQRSDALEDTVDYGALAQTAADVVGQRSFQLLEALAGRLADALLITQNRWLTFTRRLWRDWREHRKPAWYLIRQGWLKARTEPTVVAHQRALGARPVSKAQARACLAALSKRPGRGQPAAA